MSAPTSSAGPPGQYSIRVLHPLARYIVDHFGPDELDAVASAVALSAQELLGGKQWITHDQAEAVHVALFERLGRDEARFVDACGYQLRESAGPLRLVLWTTSPGRLFRLATRTASLFSATASFAVVDSGRSWMEVRYTSALPESRLLCLARQANGVYLPTLWGLPPAELEEKSCIARGDSACVYRVSWWELRRWLPALAGLGIGVVAASALLSTGLVGWLAAGLLALMGLLVGSSYERGRVYRTHLRRAEESRDASQQLAQEATAVQREILALHQRQGEWARLMEQQVAERTAAVQSVVDRLRLHQEEQVTTLRGFSHDLRNPLAAMKMLNHLLGEVGESDPAERASLIEDQGRAVAEMEQLIVELMGVATAEGGWVKAAPERVEISPLVDRLRARLRALVYGRDVRASVFSSREAPEAIEIEPVLLDRIVDNLLTNAAKYTDRGSVVVEISGVPDHLVLKVSDTGCGIPADKIERVFTPAGSDPTSRAPDSYGLGLSVVVRLLADVNGRLEVMSRPGQGTTFWIYLPVEAHRGSEPGESEPLRSVEDGAVGNVVKIRQVH